MQRKTALGLLLAGGALFAIGGVALVGLGVARYATARASSPASPPLVAASVLRGGGGIVDTSPIVPDPALRYVQAKKRPCCSLVAVFALARAGRVPSDPTNTDQWFNLDPKAWRRLNLSNEGDLGKYSDLDAAQELLGGSIALYEPGQAPVLTAGRVHIFQRWYMNGGKLEGHAGIVEDAGDPATVRLLDSNTARGYLDRPVARGSWRGRGDRVGVLTLPA